jgi:hypothetical protein
MVRRDVRHFVDEILAVNELHLFDRAHRRIAPFERGEFRRAQGLQHGLQPFGRFGVMRAGLMIQAGGMRVDEGGRHGVLMPGRPGIVSLMWMFSNEENALCSASGSGVFVKCKVATFARNN